MTTTYDPEDQAERRRVLQNDARVRANLATAIAAPTSVIPILRLVDALLSRNTKPVAACLATKALATNPLFLYDFMNCLVSAAPSFAAPTD